MRRLPLFLAVFLLVTAGPALRAEEEDANDPAFTAEQRDRAIIKAFAYLDDNLGKLQDGGSPRKPFASAVAGLACLLAGAKGDGRKLPGRRSELKSLFDDLDGYVDRVARLYEKDARPPTDGPPGFAGLRTSQFCWPLGVAGMFFAESYARGGRKGESKKALAKIARILESAQHTDGGWGHDDPEVTGLLGPEFKIPKPGGGSITYPRTLYAATNCAATGLGLAHAVLKTKEPESVAKAIGYYRTGQERHGTWPYDPTQKLPGAVELTSLPVASLDVARSTGCVFALGCLGVGLAESPAAEGVEPIDRHPEWWGEGHGSATLALQFSALLAAARGGESWETFRTTWFPRILEAQEENGAFLCACREASLGVTCDTKPIPGMPDLGWSEGNKVYVTAIHTLILLLDRAKPEMLPKLGSGKRSTTPR